MAGRNDHIGNFDRQLIIGLQLCSSDSDCYLSHMWDLYNGMVSDRISQPGKKNKSRNLMEKQSDENSSEMDWKMQWEACRFCQSFFQKYSRKNKSSACGRSIFILAVPDHWLRIHRCRSIPDDITDCRCGCCDFYHQKSGWAGSYYGWSEENKRWRTAV